MGSVFRKEIARYVKVVFVINKSCLYLYILRILVTFINNSKKKVYIAILVVK